MQPVMDAKVLVEAVGEDDLPVQNATTRWVSSHPECVPAGLTLSDDRGMIAHEIAHGTHKLVVTAPERMVVEQDVVLVPGDDKVIRIRLGTSKIVVEKEQIRILEKVQFETAKAVIRPESFGLLDEVAAVILANPDLGRVEVAGHTDDRGSDAYNQKLSEDRARSVAEYLQGKGIDPGRLVSVGYGETRPLETNRTESGREANRRVEFNLIDQIEPSQEKTP
ncbi:MAG: OmpA family protein [Alphaproteobacteria bacterium]|nr:OmpA family protein [Alphaproteobacteria bacterium]MCB9698470.1 OmpA family protein [Alphaproteobacteria bacterium]